MIGIDLVDSTRFETTEKLSRFLDRFRTDGNTPMAMAKTWACLEAIIKAEDQPFDPTRIRILFPKHQRPVVEDPDHVLSSSYILSVSHENKMVIAIAVRV
jgi:phosphopantetheinyl transferase (holo-ACP synthase)